MRQIGIHIILILCTFTLHAQINLVPNPSFEENDSCYQGSFPIILDTQDVAARSPNNWIRIIGSPDCYKFCDTSSLNKLIFYQSPKTGVAMLGLLSYSNDTSIQRNYFGKGMKENVSVRLKKPLVKDKLYKLVFYTNLANYKQPAKVLNENRLVTNSLGGYFSVTKLPFFEYPIISLKLISPQILNDTSKYLMDTIGWDKVEGLYLSQGGEEWLTIGDFDSRNMDKLVFKNVNNSNINFSYYYFIDDVSVTYFDTVSHTMDTTLCNGRNLIFSKRPDWDSCVWYDGSHDSSKVFTQSGVYWVTNFYAGFTVTDTLKVTFTDSLPTQLYYTGFCVGDSVLLTARNAQTYLWSTGNTNQQCYAAQTDTLVVIGTTNGCVVTDTFYVQAFTNPIISGLSDTVVCFDDIQKVKLDGGEHYTYLWQPTGETTQTIYSTQAMLYTLTVSDSNGCKASEQVAVDEECAVGFYIPNAFSPNGDGINEELKIVLPRGKLIRFEVYNRWGQLLESNTTGTWSGYQAQEGVYVISITYTDQTGKKQYAKGNVTLLR